jgi:hypothetical protein
MITRSIVNLEENGPPNFESISFLKGEQWVGGVGGGEVGDVRSFSLLKLQVGRRPSSSSLQLCNLDLLLMQIECKFQILECRSSRSVCIKKTKGEKFVV